MALLIVFLVLSAQFGSFIHLIVIMRTVLLAISGALFGLWAFGGSMNIYSQIGMTILMAGLWLEDSELDIETRKAIRKRAEIRQRRTNGQGSAPRSDTPGSPTT